MNTAIRILAIYGAISLTYRAWCCFLFFRRQRELFSELGTYVQCKECNGNGGWRFPSKERA
jgi:hypothetical protein